MERNARSTRSWNKSNDFTTTSVASFSPVEAAVKVLDILLSAKAFVVFAFWGNFISSLKEKRFIKSRVKNVQPVAPRRRSRSRRIWNARRRKRRIRRRHELEPTTETRPFKRRFRRRISSLAAHELRPRSVEEQSLGRGHVRGRTQMGQWSDASDNR